MELPKVLFIIAYILNTRLLIEFSYEIILDDRNTYILVIEWANGGSLRNFLKCNFSSLANDAKLRLAKEITKGLMCLHQKGIIHRDLVIHAILYIS